MNYLKKIYLNWFVIGLTVGLIPYVITLIKNSSVITIGPISYLLILLLPFISLKLMRRLARCYKNYIR